MGNRSVMHYTLCCIIHQRCLSYFWDSGYYVLISSHLLLVEDQVLSFGRDTVEFTLIATNKTVSFCFCTHTLFFLFCSIAPSLVRNGMQQVVIPYIWPCITHFSSIRDACASKNPTNQCSELFCYSIIPNRSAKKF